MAINETPSTTIASKNDAFNTKIAAWISKLNTGTEQANKLLDILSKSGFFPGLPTDVTELEEDETEQTDADGKD